MHAVMAEQAGWAPRDHAGGQHKLVIGQLVGTAVGAAHRQPPAPGVEADGRGAQPQVNLQVRRSVRGPDSHVVLVEDAGEELLRQRGPVIGQL